MSAPRQFAKVAAAVWTSKRFRALSEQAKLLLLYFMTCRHQNSTGAFRAPVGYLCVDLGWGEDKVHSGLAELVEQNLVAHDAEEDEFFVLGWFRFNPPMNSSHAAGTVKLMGDIKSEVIASIAVAELEAAIAADPVVAAAVKGRSKLEDTSYMRGPRRDR